MPSLSVLIPARNEQFLPNTVSSILANIRGDTEIIVVLDGYKPETPYASDPRVRIVHNVEAIGQRQATNQSARLSSAKFIMKIDAHCTVDEGFDVKLMQDCQYDWTVVPRMYNLHVFDWLCKKCGHRAYQGPRPDLSPTKKCEKCDANRADQFEMVMVWTPRWSRRSDYMRFDNTLHFQYWGSMGKRPGMNEEITDQMSCVGACWMMHRERYWELGGMDERHGSWGQMGTELSCKTWLSGGRQVVNKRTWFSHLFRTQPGFGFPYPNPGIDKARQHSRWLWFGGNYDKAIYPLSWMINKFAPVPDWDDASMKLIAKDIVHDRKHMSVASSPRVCDLPPAVSPAVKKEKAHLIETVPSDEERDSRVLTKGIVYYTENQCPEPIFSAVQKRIKQCVNGSKIVSVSLQPIGFGNNIVLPLKRGILTMFKQILAGLEALDTDIAYLCEHDVLYAKEHFDFIPPREDEFYYNEHAYRCDASSGQALFYFCKQTSGLCAYRKLLVEHYRKRIAKVMQNAEDLRQRGEKVKNDGYSRHMGFEPGCHMEPRGVDNYKAVRRWAEVPNIDVRHSHNLTPSRWSQDQFRNKDSCLGWKLCDDIPGWGKTKGRFNEFLMEVTK